MNEIPFALMMKIVYNKTQTSWKKMTESHKKTNTLLSRKRPTRHRIDPKPDAIRIGQNYSGSNDLKNRQQTKSQNNSQKCSSDSFQLLFRPET